MAKDSLTDSTDVSSPADEQTGFFTLIGRTNRKKYLFQILLPAGVSAIGSMAAGSAESAGIGAIFLLAGAVLSIFPGVRRLHDLNASGWWLLVSLIPLLNLVLGLTLLFKKGTDGPNDYGPDPLLNGGG